MESLKRELLQAQKTRDDLMRWKLLLVAAIGAAGLGFSGASVPGHAALVLCLIPLACCYVDLLCRNLSVRTKLLSGFLSAEFPQHAEDVTARYEEFYQRFDARRDTATGDALEGFALLYSTRLLSIAVMLAGVFAYLGWPSLLFLGSGAGGLLISWLVEREYRAQKDLITATVKGWTDERRSVADKKRERSGSTPDAQPEHPAS